MRRVSRRVRSLPAANRAPVRANVKIAACDMFFGTSEYLIVIELVSGSMHRFVATCKGHALLREL